MTIVCKNKKMILTIDDKYCGSANAPVFTGNEEFLIGAFKKDNRLYCGSLDLFDFHITKDGKEAVHYIPKTNVLANNKLEDSSGNNNHAELSGNLNFVDAPGFPSIFHFDAQRSSNIDIENLFDTSRKSGGRIGLRFNGSDTYASIPVSLKDCTDWSVDLKLATTHVSLPNYAGYHQPTIFGYDSPNFRSRDSHIDVSEGRLFIFNGLLCDASRCDIKAGIMDNFSGDISWKTQQFIADGNPHSIRVECRRGMLYVWLDGKCLGSMHTQTTIDSSKLYLGASFDSEKIYAAFDLFDFQLRKDGELVASYKPNDAEVTNRKMMIDHSGHGNNGILEAGNFTMVDYREPPTIIYCDTQRDVGRYFAVTNVFDTIRKAYDGISTELDTSRKLNRMLLGDFDSQRKIARETSDTFNTARKVAAYVESPDNLDTNRRVAVSSSDNLDAERKIGIELVNNLDSYRKLQNDADNVFDTSREIKELIDAIDTFDTSRGLYATPLNGFDTQRRVRISFAMSYEYDTSRKLKGNHDEAFDANRNILNESVNSFEAERNVRTEQSDVFDSYRAILNESLCNLDTHRGTLVELGEDFDLRRSAANEVVDGFNSQRSIINDVSGQLDSIRKINVQDSGDFNSLRRLHTDSEDSFNTNRQVEVNDSEEFSTVRAVAADTLNGYDTARVVDIESANEFNTGRQVGVEATYSWNTDRRISSVVSVRAGTSRKTNLDVISEHDTSRKPVAAAEPLFDTCIKYVFTHFSFDTSRKVTVPKYNGFNTVHKEVVGAVNEIYADLQCARRAAAEADLKAQRNKEAIAKLNAKVDSIEITGGGGSSVEGPAGPKGDRGDVGPAGPSGVDGKSAMDIANELRLKKGYKPFMSEEDFIESLRGKAGEDGRDGTDAYIDPASLANNPALVNKYVTKADMVDKQGKEVYAKAADLDQKADRLYVDEALNDKAEAIAVTALMTAVHSKQDKGDYVTKDEMNTRLMNTVDEDGVKAIISAMLSSGVIKKMISDAVAEAMSKQ